MIERIEPQNIVEVLLITNDYAESDRITRVLRAAHFANEIKLIGDVSVALDFLQKANTLPKLLIISDTLPISQLEDFLLKIQDNSALRNIPTALLASDESPLVNIKHSSKKIWLLPRPFEFDVFMKRVSEAGFSWVIVSHAGH